MQIIQVYAAYDQTKHPPADEFKYCPFCTTQLISKPSGNKPRPTCPACGFIQFKNPAPALSVLVVQDGKVLLGKRGGAPGAGKWSFPSGYVEYEDDFLTTAIKEVKEETGLDVEIESIINLVSSFLSPRFHFLSPYLLARVLGGELAARDDLEAVDWFPLSGPLPDMAFQEDVDVLDMVATGEFESLPVDPRFARPGKSDR